MNTHAMDLLIKTVEKKLVETIDSKELQLTKKMGALLEDLYAHKSAMLQYYQNITFGFTMAAKKVQALNELNNRIDEILQPHLIEDPLVVKVEKKPDLNYTIAGQAMKFKVDTGATTSVIDAENIDWPLLDEQRSVLEVAYSDFYVKKYPDAGYMTYDKMVEVEASFAGVQFGEVKSFDMVVHRQDKKNDNVDEIEKDAPDVLKHISGPFKVIGISNPKAGGVRAGLRPVVALPILGAGFEQGGEQPFSLVNRATMTRRGLIGRNHLADAGMSIVFDSRDTRIIDPVKLPDVVEQVTLASTVTKLKYL